MNRNEIRKESEVKVENVRMNDLNGETKPRTGDKLNDLNKKQNDLSKGVRRGIDFDEESNNSYVPPLPPKMENLEPLYKRLQSYSLSDLDGEPYDSGYSSNPSSEKVLNSTRRPGENKNKLKAYSRYDLEKDFPIRTHLQNLEYDVPPSQYLLYDRPTMRMAYRKEVAPLYDRPRAPPGATEASSLYDRPISLLPSQFSSPYYERPTLKVAERKELSPSSKASPSKDPNAPPLPSRKPRRYHSKDYLDVTNRGYLSDTPGYFTKNHGYISDTYGYFSDNHGYTSDDTDDVFVIGNYTISKSPTYRNPPSLYFPDPPTYPPPPSHLDTSPSRRYNPRLEQPPVWDLSPRNDIGFRNPGFLWQDDHPSAFKVISPEREREIEREMQRHDTFRSDSTGSVYIPYQRESLV